MSRALLTRVPYADAYELSLELQEELDAAVEEHGSIDLALAECLRWRCPDSPRSADEREYLEHYADELASASAQDVPERTVLDEADELIARLQPVKAERVELRRMIEGES
ncbi:MAG: hypothetical protein R3337_00220 [Gammaproteobacteria bacterium]|nr:hypothetical protein [Gammaproteobacteria bacterium]